MQTTTSADFHRRIGHYQDRALVEPIMVTRNGRNRVVLISADEFHRLKRLERDAQAVSSPAASGVTANPAGQTQDAA